MRNCGTSEKPPATEASRLPPRSSPTYRRPLGCCAHPEDAKFPYRRSGHPRRALDDSDVAHAVQPSQVEESPLWTCRRTTLNPSGRKVRRPCEPRVYMYELRRNTTSVPACWNKRSVRDVTRSRPRSSSLVAAPTIGCGQLLPRANMDPHPEPAWSNTSRSRSEVFLRLRLCVSVQNTFCAANAEG